MSSSSANSLQKSEKGMLVNNYTDDEVTLIYELARLSFESGNHRRAESLARGLVAVAPDFIPSYLLLAIVLSFAKSYEQATDYVQSAIRLDDSCLEAHLLGASIYMTSGDFTMAGTMLGEVAERIKSDPEVSPALRNFYQIQLTRFEQR